MAVAEARNDEIEDVKVSYGRAVLAPKFFDDFYDRFLASSPEIKLMFAKTDLTKQKKLVREGVSFLVMFAAGAHTGKTKIEALAKSHDRKHLNVRPDMYRLWIDSLMFVVAKYDPKYEPALEGKWRRVLEKGISAMKAGY